jgi:hypothetical protein
MMSKGYLPQRSGHPTPCRATNVFSPLFAYQNITNTPGIEDELSLYTPSRLSF